MLLKYGADPNIKNKNRTTPLGTAVKGWVELNENVEYFEKVSYLLVNKGAKLDIH